MIRSSREETPWLRSVDRFVVGEPVVVPAAVVVPVSRLRLDAQLAGGHAWAQGLLQPLATIVADTSGIRVIALQEGIELPDRILRRAVAAAADARDRRSS